MKPWSRIYSGWFKNRRVLFPLVVLVSICLAAVSCDLQGQPESSINPIRPYTENPFYWQYNNEPVLLLETPADGHQVAVITLIQ